MLALWIQISVTTISSSIVGSRIVADNGIIAKASGLSGQGQDVLVRLWQECLILYHCRWLRQTERLDL